ncbi:MAG: hypothetical protein ABIZ04_24600 [Opitutus sp.]
MNDRLRNSRPLFAPLLGFFLTLNMTGCTDARRVTLTAVGHEVSADIEGTQSVDDQPTQTVISSQFGKVMVERSRVRVEGLQWAAIAEHVPIAVKIFEHKLTVKAGGVFIARTIR